MAYTQEELINMAMDGLKAMSKREKLGVKLPTINHTRHKTTIINFKGMCDGLNRGSKEDTEYIKRYIEKETGKASSINIKNDLTLEKRETNEKLESVIKRYIKDFVLCKTCSSQVTSIVKIGKLRYIKCNRCGSQNCIANY